MTYKMEETYFKAVTMKFGIDLNPIPWMIPWSVKSFPFPVIDVRPPGGSGDVDEWYEEFLYTMTS